MVIPHLAVLFLLRCCCRLHCSWATSDRAFHSPDWLPPKQPVLPSSEVLRFRPVLVHRTRDRAIALNGNENGGQLSKLAIGRCHCAEFRWNCSEGGCWSVEVHRWVVDRNRRLIGFFESDCSGKHYNIKYHVHIFGLFEVSLHCWSSAGRIHHRTATSQIQSVVLAEEFVGHPVLRLITIDLCRWVCFCSKSEF